MCPLVILYNFVTWKEIKKTKTEANYLILSINYVYKALLLPYAY